MKRLRAIEAFSFLLKARLFFIVLNCMLKNEIRKLYKQKRLELSATERLKYDDLLLIQLQRLPLNDVHAFLSYWPLESQNEVNTHLLTYYLEKAIPDVRVAYPVIDGDQEIMEAVLVEEETDFVENKYGIAEPETGDRIAPAELDLILVPLLAFDTRGYRVGYGKGYYDKYLMQCRTDVITVGFSYLPPIDKIDDAHQFDVPLKYCITPDRIYEF